MSRNPRPTSAPRSATDIGAAIITTIATGATGTTTGRITTATATPRVTAMADPAITAAAPASPSASAAAAIAAGNIEADQAKSPQRCGLFRMDYLDRPEADAKRTTARFPGLRETFAAITTVRPLILRAAAAVRSI